MYSSILISVLASSLISLSLACSAANEGDNRTRNENVHTNTLYNSGDLIEIESYEFVEEDIVKNTKAISKKIGLAALPQSTQREEFELRLWTNLGGLGNAKLLVVRSIENVNYADFFDVDRALDPIRFQKENREGPQSGWNKLLSDLRRQLTTPKGLIRDPNFQLNRDEPVILLEVLDKGEYRRILYGQSTSSQDGQRLIGACNYLANEFDVDMKCPAVR